MSFDHSFQQLLEEEPQKSGRRTLLQSSWCRDLLDFALISAAVYSRVQDEEEEEEQQFTRTPIYIVYAHRDNSGLC